MVLELVLLVGTCFSSSSLAVERTSIRSTENLSPDYVFMQNADYFCNGNLLPFSFYDPNNVPSAYDYGPLFAFILLSYYDLFHTDLMVPEAFDFVVETSDVSDFSLVTPMNFLEQLIVSGHASFTYTEDFIDDQNISYYLPDSSEYEDNPFFYSFLDSYFTYMGFEEKTSLTAGDYSSWVSRGGVWFYYSQGSIELLPLGGCIEHGHYAVDNNIPAVATLRYSQMNDGDTDLPYFVLGYVYQTIGDGPLLLYNPTTGMIVANEYEVYEVTTFDFYGTHIHSDNVIDDPLFCCPCGHTDLSGHDHESYEYHSSSQHVSECDYCGLTTYENHDYHYQRLNDTWHRKYCPVCGYSTNELHTGRWCQCLLYQG